MAEQDERVAAAATAFAGLGEALRKRFPEREHVVDSLELALLAREHLLLFGPPGTGKSELAATGLRSLLDDTGRPSVFSRQIVETTVQQDLVGPVDFKVLTETGRTQHRIEEGLLAFEMAVLDEAFDARDLLLRSLFSVLNERELAVGGEVVRARLGTAVFTTNRYLSELLAARPDTLLAFSDRVSFAAYVPKGFAQANSRLALLSAAAGRGVAWHARVGLKELALLQEAARQIPVDEEALVALSGLADLWERAQLGDGTTNERRPMATRYLSGRALNKAVGIWRAAVLRDRLVLRRDGPMRVTSGDVALLEPFFTLSGPPAERLDALLGQASDPRDQAQLKLVAAEQAQFRRALLDLKGRLKQELLRESAELGLPEIFRPDVEANRTLAGFLSSTALSRARHGRHRDELRRMLVVSARRFIDECASGVTDLAQSDRLDHLAAMAEVLAQQERPDLARQLADTVLSALRTSTLAAPDVLAAEEFSGSRIKGLADLADRARKQLARMDELERRFRAFGQLAQASEETVTELNGALTESRRRIALNLRRAVGNVLRRSAGADLSALPGDFAALGELEQVVRRLDPHAPAQRTDLLASRAAGLLRHEFTQRATTRLKDLVDFVVEAGARLRVLDMEAGPVLSLLREPVTERFAQWLSRRLPASRPAGTGPLSEVGYAQLTASCSAFAERAMGAELARQLGAEEGDEAFADLLRRLDVLDVAELGEQVDYLLEWFGQVARGVPAPADLITLAQADAAWNLVSASRFYGVTWKGKELATLQERLRIALTLPHVAEQGQLVAASLDVLSRNSERFGRGLLEQRARLGATQG